MLSMLIAYDAAGQIVATLDHLVTRDEDGQVVGLVDFDAHETAGGEMTDVWTVEGASGSKTWPEWLGARAHDFRVELAGEPGRKRAVALVHKTSGHRRERQSIDDEIQRRTQQANGEPVDARDLLGGPDRPLLLDENGATKPRANPEPTTLPLVAVTQQS